MEYLDCQNSGMTDMIVIVRAAGCSRGSWEHDQTIRLEYVNTRVC